MTEPANTEIKYSVEWEIAGVENYSKLTVVAPTGVLQYYKGDDGGFPIHDTGEKQEFTLDIGELE